jgi:serine/threonine-protein kinase HipA
MDCHLQLFNNGRWHDAAIVSVAKPELGGVRGAAFLEYELPHTFETVNPKPVSLTKPVTGDIRHLKQWPAFLYDLISQGNGRKYLLGELRLADDQTSDFALLCAGAINPIGRLRVREAVDYYRTDAERFALPKAFDGMTFDKGIAPEQGFMEQMLVHGMLAAGTTGVQGAAPKYLITRDHCGLWHADGALADEKAAQHFLIKLPRGKAVIDRKVLRNEAAYMRVTSALGMRVHGKVEVHNDMLFIPRFDRRVGPNGVERLHQESAASLAGVVGFEHRPSQFTLLNAIRHVVTNKTAETVEFLCRDVLNLAMHNTDNHARNTAVQFVDDVVQLTPLFDFAPMYLDPEGIARAARWHHPQTRQELTTWGNIIAAIGLDTNEQESVCCALAAFAGQLQALPDIMRAAAVDDDILNTCCLQSEIRSGSYTNSPETGHG